MKAHWYDENGYHQIEFVAFTPKGGCPLKAWWSLTTTRQATPTGVAFTPKGGCPLKALDAVGEAFRDDPVAFTPKGGCPLKAVHVIQHRLSGGLM